MQLTALKFAVQLANNTSVTRVSAFIEMHSVRFRDNKCRISSYLQEKGLNYKITRSYVLMESRGIWGMVI